MMPRVYIDTNDVSGAILFESFKLNRSSDTRIATAEFTLRQTARPARWGEAKWGVDHWSVDVKLRSSVRIYDVSQLPHVPRFGGYCSYFDYSRQGPQEMRINVKCQDYGVWLENTVIDSHNFGLDKSDAQILTIALNTYASGVLSPAGVQSVVPVVPIGIVQGWTLRQLLDWLTDLSDAHWHISPDGVLVYHAQDASPSPYGFSDTPDLVTTFPFGVTQFSRDFARPINHVVVTGGALPGGSVLKVEYEDPVSILKWQRHTTTILDKELTDANEALLRAESIVEQNSQPKESGSLVTYVDLFEVGDTVHIKTDEFAINGDYALTSCDVQQLNPELTRYTYGFGAKPPDTDRLLRLLERFMRTEAGSGVSIGVPAAGSVTTNSLAPGFSLTAGYIAQVNAGAIIGQIAGGQIGTINAAQVIGNIAAGGNLTVSAGAINGVIQGPNVQVAAAVINGVIISNQLADGIIDNLAKMTAAMRPVRMVQTAGELPSVMPDKNFPAGAYFHYVPNGHFYQVTPDGLSWTDAGTNPNALTGQLSLYHIGMLAAQNITGLIVSAQIDTIAASKITGAINAANITLVNASAIQGVIDATHIGGIAANLIQGQIQAGQIAAINANIIQGTLQGSQVANINAGTITIGLLDSDNRISRISGAKLDVGTVNSDRLNSLAIAVGGGGGKPGRLEVFGASNNLIGFIGVNGATEGGYFTTMGIGGTQTTPAIFASASGATRINNADFTIASFSGGTIEIKQFTFDPFYTSVGVKAVDPNNQYTCWHVSRGLVGSTTTGRAYSINISPTNPFAGEMVLYRTGSIVILADGNTGTVRAEKFQCGGNPGFTGSIPASAVLNVQGGIIVSYS